MRPSRCLKPQTLSREDSGRKERLFKAPSSSLQGEQFHRRAVTCAIGRIVTFWKLSRLYSSPPKIRPRTLFLGTKCCEKFAHLELADHKSNQRLMDVEGQGVRRKPWYTSLASR